MAESFVAVCDMFLSCLQNVRVIFYLKHGKQAALSLILLVTFDVTNVTLAHSSLDVLLQ